MSDDYVVVLQCTRCERLREFEIVKEASDGKKIVDCEECGKRHGQDSLTLVEP